VNAPFDDDDDDVLSGISHYSVCNFENYSLPGFLRNGHCAVGGFALFPLWALADLCSLLDDDVDWMV
jgi:hypothetical protein